MRGVRHANDKISVYGIYYYNNCDGDEKVEDTTEIANNEGESEWERNVVRTYVGLFRVH